MIDISVIIPFSSKEDLLSEILSDLKNFPLKEILVVGERKIKFPNDPKIQFIKSSLGRAMQMNTGSKVASGKFLWFLHADSRIESKDFDIFYKSLKLHPEDLHYFTLNFSPPSFKMGLNKFGTQFRSNYLKLPFGDQGFSISKEQFQKIGEFPLVALGEDLIFVLNARKKGINIRNCGAEIYTSPRKYKKHGWLKTTLTHIFYTFKIVFGRKTI